MSCRATAQRTPLATTLLATTLLATMLLFASGCVGVGALRESRLALTPDGADRVTIAVDMSVGELGIEGGPSELMAARFETNVNAWTPQVHYRVRDGSGLLRLSSPEDSRIPLGEIHNEWNVALTEDLPLDLHVELGLGEAQLDLRRVQLRRLRVDVGAGELRVNLARAWEQDLRVSIDAGVGEVRVILPKSVGVRVHADSGIGSIHAPHLERDGDELRNELVGVSPVTVDITVDIGIGEIRFEEAPGDDYQQRSTLSDAGTNENAAGITSVIPTAFSSNES